MTKREDHPEAQRVPLLCNMYEGPTYTRPAEVSGVLARDEMYIKCRWKEAAQDTEIAVVRHNATDMEHQQLLTGLTYLSLLGI